MRAASIATPRSFAAKLLLLTEFTYSLSSPPAPIREARTLDRVVASFRISALNQSHGVGFAAVPASGRRKVPRSASGPETDA